jgi:sulfur carrier protein
MNVVVNSKPKTISTGLTVKALLAHLEVGEKGVAVEVNAELVTRNEWPRFELKENDRVEIVTFVGGG